MILMLKESYELPYGFRLYIDAIGQARVKLFSEKLSFYGQRKTQFIIKRITHPNNGRIFAHVF